MSDEASKSSRADAGLVQRPVRPVAWKCSRCGHTSTSEGLTPGDSWCSSCGAVETMRALYDEADTLELADQVLTLNNALLDAEVKSDRLRALVRECEPAVYSQHMREIGSRIAKPGTLLARVREA